VSEGERSEVTELEKIAWTATATLAGGSILFVINSVVTKLFIEPLYALRRTIGKVSFALVFYANVITNRPDDAGKERFNEASDTIRKLASRLRANACVLPCYRCLACLRVVPARENIHEAARLLIRVSNSSLMADQSKVVDDIGRIGVLLGIDVAK
jgi:hypothetical protein